MPRYADQATGDLRADLAENRTVPILQQISKAGFEYLDRAHSIYEHALQLQGLDGALLQKVTEIGAEIEEADFAAASRQKPSR